MNIQQLNNSGQSIQTYLVTAVLILLLTGGLWLCGEQVNRYHEGIPGETRMYTIAERVRLLVWLYCNGHWLWVRKTKAWWYILANSNIDEQDGFASSLPDDMDVLDRDVSALLYISMYMYSSKCDRAFSVEGWNKKKKETASD